MPILASLVLATSSISTAIYAADRFRRQQLALPTSENATLTTEVNPQEVVLPNQANEEIDHYFAVSSLSLGLTMGGMIFPPLMAASFPLNVYTTIPTVRNAWQAWSDERRINFNTFESSVVIGAMVTGHYLTASSVDWVYYFARKLKSQVRTDMNTLIQKAAESRTVWTDYEGSELQVPLSKIENGDTIILRDNDFVPFSGQVTQGEATLNTYTTTNSADPVHVEIGNIVPPYALVVSGNIHLRVIK